MIQLDFQQRQAVQTKSNKVLVLAGAGSGKTRVLIERIAHLVETQKVSPFEIMAFTFTRKAAGEIRTRLEDRIDRAAYRCTLGTMHAIGLNMIHRFGEQIGFRADNTTVYCQWETDYLIKQIAIELKIYNGKVWKPTKTHINEIFNHYYQTGEEPEGLDPAVELFNEFISRCRENNALTYGALLIGLKMLIPTMAKHLHIKHILIDETQDIDPLQWKIIFKMAELFDASLFCVGDLDQSIYEFRGAVPEYLLKISDYFDVYKIESNYRSAISIVEAANKLIEHNEKRLEKFMRPTRKELNHIIVQKDCDSAATKLVVESTLELIKHSDVAVLARNHVLIKKLSGILNDDGIDHVYIGAKSALTNSEEFRRFHAFLKLVVNPYDNFAFLLIRDFLGLSKEVYQEIRTIATQRGSSHFQAWEYYMQNIDIHRSGIPSEFENFFLNTEKELSGDAFLMQVGYLEAMVQEEGEAGTETAKSIYTPAANFIEQWSNQNHNGTVEDYLGWLATYDLQDEIEEDSDRLQLMTIHAAKGLEWPVVILAGVNEDILPSKQSIKKGDIEDETRLCYVAVTRAENHLILCVRPEQKITETKVYNNPESRYIKWMEL